MNTTPGLDQISYSMLSNLPSKIQNKLLKLFNNISGGEPITVK